MSAYDHAVVIYASKGLDFAAELNQYTQYGYVYVTPECIILAEVQGTDTWFIQFAIGSGWMQHFLEMAPFKLPKVAWKRGLRENAKIKTYQLSQIERIIYGRRITTSSTSTSGTTEHQQGQCGSPGQKSKAQGISEHDSNRG